MHTYLTQVLRKVSGQIKAGELTAIMGPSGSGDTHLSLNLNPNPKT